MLESLDRVGHSSIVNLFSLSKAFFVFLTCSAIVLLKALLREIFSSTKNHLFSILRVSYIRVQQAADKNRRKISVKVINTQTMTLSPSATRLERYIDYFIVYYH